MQSFSFLQPPKKTPWTISVCLWLLLTSALISPIATFFFNTYLHRSGPIQWLALSAQGLQNGDFWQLISYIFIHSPSSQISLSFLITLFVSLAFFRFFALHTYARVGQFAIFLIYYGATLIAGVVAGGVMILSNNHAMALTTNSPGILALFFLWLMFYPDVEFQVPYLATYKIKNIATITVAMFLLSRLSSGNWILILADITAMSWSFLIGTFFWNLPNPYKQTSDHRLHSNTTKSFEPKIIDIPFTEESDEEFTERMLDKISREGRDSLTGREQARLKKVWSKE